MITLPHRIPRIKLRVKFMGFSIAIALFPLLLVTVLVINRLQSIQRENAINVNRELAQAAAKEIEKFIISQYDILKQLDIVYAQKDISADVQSGLVERFLFLNDNFTDITILDKNGQERIRKNLIRFYTVDDLVDRSRGTEFTTIRQNRYYFSPLSITNGKPTFTIGIPIIGVDGSFYGAALAEVDARVMENVVKKISVVEKKGKAYIVNEKGIVIAHPDISNVVAQKDFSHYPPVKQIVYRDVSIKPLDIYRNEDNQEVLGTGFPITIPYNAPTPTTNYINWFIIIEQPAETVLAQVYLITRFALLALSAVVVIATVVSSLFARRIVLPIELVHAASQQIRAGALDHRITIHTNDEIEDLANGFNSMADSLQDAFHKVEQDKHIISIEKNKLEVTLASIVDAVIAVDREKKIIVFNAAAEHLLDIKSGDALGKSIDQIITVFHKDAEVLSSVYCPPGSLNSEEIAFSSHDLRIINQKGKRAYVDLIVGPIKEATGMDRGYILSLHDVTKEKELEQMKLDFVSMAAHELRTPLTAIKGYLSLLIQDKEKHPITEEQSMYISRIYHSSDQLAALVENILSASRIERNAFSISIKSIDWTETIQGVIGDLKEIAKEKNVQLVFHEPDQPRSIVKADKFRISQVLTNLLTNAITYTPAGGMITVSVERKDNDLVTHIQDTGEGIPVTALPHLFTKFFRVSSRLEQGAKGTGLGLFISKSIVESHKGKIWVESVEKQGSTFSFSLPLA